MVKREGQERGPPCSLEAAHLFQGKQCLSWVTKGKGKGATTGGREVTRLEIDSGRGKSLHIWALCGREPRASEDFSERGQRQSKSSSRDHQSRGDMPMDRGGWRGFWHQRDQQGASGLRCSRPGAVGCSQRGQNSRNTGEQSWLV